MSRKAVKFSRINPRTYTLHRTKRDAKNIYYDPFLTLISFAKKLFFSHFITRFSSAKYSSIDYKCLTKYGYICVETKTQPLQNYTCVKRY